MLTDWILVRRLAQELRTQCAGSRVVDFGRTGDGLPALELHKRGERTLLSFALFESPPLVMLQPGELPLQSEPGFIRTAGAALRGTTILTVESRTGDRLLRIICGARSRFGVKNAYTLIAELVPRFGNLVLLRDEKIVCALKEFHPSGKSRAIEPGAIYELPAVPEKPRTLAPVGEISADESLYVYRDERGGLVQAYVAPIPEREETAGREPSLLGIFTELHGAQRSKSQVSSGSTRRASLEKALAKRVQKLRSELNAVEDKLNQSQTRENIRRQGEDIFARLHELEPAQADQAKEDARKLFARYRKLQAALPHLQARQQQLESDLEAAMQLAWELERADADAFEDVAGVVKEFCGERAHSAPVRKRKQRERLTIRTTSGSRIYVGRSPLENAELTFRVARPDDLWFHAQKIPGAHVILQRDDNSAPPQEDIERAAALAAWFSKAKHAAHVPVDFTRRKFVRKQRSAAPGLVFYTEPATVFVDPREP